jgi:hypothetical protein
MQEIIQKYLKSDFGEIEIPGNDQEKLQLARALLGYSIVHEIDYWLDIAKDYVQNKEPKEPFLRDNEASRKDKAFRNSFSKLDDKTKTMIVELVNSTATGIVFSLLTNFDHFDFGELILSLKPKSEKTEEIKISSDTEDLHDELAEWIYTFSKFKEDLVEKEEHKNGVSYRLK